MEMYWPFIAFGVAFAALAVWLVKRGRAQRAERAEKLVQMGFEPCSSEAEALAERLARHENNSRYRYRVEDPARAALEGKPVYYYTKERKRQGQIMAAQEFLFPLVRCSSEGLVLFFKPSALRSGTSATLIGSLATSGWDSQPDDLLRLEVPVDLKQSNLIGALGPANASLYELIDSKSLAAMQQVGDLGVVVVTCRGEWCSFANASTRMAFDLDGLWSVIRQLASS